MQEQSGIIMEDQNAKSECPICCKLFTKDIIEVHVNQCIFLHTTAEGTTEKKRNFTVYKGSPTGEAKKSKMEAVLISPVATLTKVPRATWHNKGRLSAWAQKNIASSAVVSPDNEETSAKSQNTLGLSTSTLLSANRRPSTLPESKDDIVKKSIPLAEKMRPETIDNYIGQSHIMGKDTVLRKILEKNEVPSMILWGPPGVGKTTLAHIIANKCKETQNCRFVKLSATMVGVNDVKQVVAAAKNEQKFKRKTILFMDEIHRFNKLQQDIFLPHVESGVITLIGATTENPSFSLNSALLSRCRVIILEKLTSENIYDILLRSLAAFEAVILDLTNSNPSFTHLDFVPKVLVQESSLKWLADIADGDARIALNSLQLAMESVLDNEECDRKHDLKYMSLDAIKDGIKRSHLLYDRKGDQHYDMISALHKSIRASDDNAALYWCTRMMMGGEDPRYICRRLVRAASEDIGLANPQAIGVALSALDAVQLVGMPESDCIIAQCAIYLARSPKSWESYHALLRCKRDINEWSGPLPSVPIHLRNAPTKLMRDLGFGKGYNTRNKNESGLEYMPEGMENHDYFGDA